jgi:pyruvate formate lyase activating enzyme
VLLGGLQKFSLIDYPGKIAAIVFTHGCNLRCPYCHNPELVLPEQAPCPGFHETEIIQFMASRKGKLDALCVTGGEPTIHTGLGALFKEIKELGFLTKLDTNGTNPKSIQELLDKDLLDYIAMDIKAPFERYPEVTRSNVNINAIKQSIAILAASNIPYELRITVVEEFITLQDIKRIGPQIQGAPLGVIQNFSPTKCLDNKFLQKAPYSANELKQMQVELSKHVSEVIIRD